MHTYQDSFDLLQQQTMVHCKTQLHQAKDDAYWKGDKVLYKQAKYTLEKEIRVAKRNYSGKIRVQFTSSDSASVWKGMKDVTNKTPSPSTVENQTTGNRSSLHTTINTSSNPLSPTPAIQISEDYWRFSTAWYGTVRHGSVRYGTAQFGSVAFPPQFSTAIEWAGLFTRRYNCAASTAVTSS